METRQFSKETLNLIKSFQRNEITEYIIYSKLAAIEKVENNKKVLEKIALEEKMHYEFWSKITQEEAKPNQCKIFFFYWLVRIMGITFGIKLMEKDESKAQMNYAAVLSHVPEAQSLINDEDEHEKQLINLIEEERLNYVGSIVLGLNDALVELTGALAGFSFALQNTRLIAMAGLISGIAAGFSMAAAEYLSQKHESAQHPLKSAIYTGTAYFVTVGILILPYLIFNQYLVCFAFTMTFALLIILAFNYYISIAKDLPFKQRFYEMAIISIVVSAITFGISVLVKKYIGIEI